MLIFLGVVGPFHSMHPRRFACSFFLSANDLLCLNYLKWIIVSFIWRREKKLNALMTTISHDYSPLVKYDTRCSWSSCNWLSFVIFWLNQKNLKPKAWERICRRPLLLDKLFTRIHELFLFTPEFAPIVATIIEVKLTLLQQVYLCLTKKF